MNGIGTSSAGVCRTILAAMTLLGQMLFGQRYKILGSLYAPRRLTIEYADQPIPLVKPPTTAAILLPFQEVVKVSHNTPLPTNTGQPNPVRAQRRPDWLGGGKCQVVTSNLNSSALFAGK
jgi:hypothetical protein